MAIDNQKVCEATKIICPNGAKLRPRGAITNAGWNAFSTLWNITISFLLAPLLIHYLGVAQYGILLLVWSVTGILGIMNFGLGEATLRYVAHYFGDGDLEGVNRVFGATLSFYVVVCAIVSGALLFCRSDGGDLSKSARGRISIGRFAFASFGLGLFIRHHKPRLRGNSHGLATV